jgi:hypothetical protein
MEGDELCDPCNTKCSSDRDTIRTPSGSASSCNFVCKETARACGPGDGQCPAGCAAGRDPDCGRANGQTCQLDSECVNGHCAGGVCCNTACNDGCRSCRVSGKVGTCSPPSGSEVCGSGANGGNGIDDNCDGTVDEDCCGTAGKACCTDRFRDDGGCQNGNTCSGAPGNKCQKCGANGQPCCFHTNGTPASCNAGTTCTLDSNPFTCQTCGGPNQICCERTTDSGDYFCNNGASCSAGFPFICPP